MTTKTSFLILLALTGIGCDGTIETTPDQGDSTVGDVGNDDDPLDDDDLVDDDTSGDDTTGDDDTSGDIDDRVGQRPATADAFNALTIDARDDHTQVYEIDANTWTTVEGEQGSTLFFSANTFLTSDGTVAEGEIEIEFIEIFDKGSMLVTDMPSLGQLPDGQLAQLISGGEHYVAASQDGEELRLDGTFTLTAPAGNTGGPDSEMTLFRAEVAEGVPAGKDDQAVWVEEDVERGGFGVGDADGGAAGADTMYWAISDQFGWTNIDRWYSDPRPKTTIHIDVPDGWDDTNAAVYMSYDGEPTALARMDTYDDTTELFSEHYGLIPVGLDVHLIFVTESDGQWSYAIQAAKIEENHLTTFASANDFVETDTDGLVNAINALP